MRSGFPSYRKSVVSCNQGSLSYSQIVNCLQLLLHLLRHMHLGMCKEEDNDLGVLYSLGPLLHQAAFLAIKVEVVDINFSFSEAATHKRCFDDLMALFTQLRQQILDEELTTWEDYQQLLAQFTQESWREDFVGISKLY